MHDGRGRGDIGSKPNDPRDVMEESVEFSYVVPEMQAIRDEHRERRRGGGGFRIIIGQ